MYSSYIRKTAIAAEIFLEDCFLAVIIGKHDSDSHFPGSLACIQSVDVHAYYGQAKGHY